MYAHRYANAVAIELKPGQGALPLPPPRVAGALLVGWLLLVAASGALAEGASPEVPRTADGKPDFSGVWQSMSGADYDLEPHAGARTLRPEPASSTEAHCRINHGRSRSVRRTSPRVRRPTRHA